MKRHPSIILILTILLASVLLFSQSASSQEPAHTPPQTPEATTLLAPTAPTNLLFSYQGQLLDAAGDPITNPALPITFSLFTTESGGTACWNEAHTVDVQNGLFHVLLGQTNAIDPGVCLSGDVYLELVVNGETMSPRELLTSVAFAGVAEDVSFPLEVEGESSNTAYLRLGKTSGSPSNFGDWVGLDFLHVNQVSPTPQFTGNPAARISAALEREDNGYGLGFWTRNSTDTFTEKLKITADGNVGIGATAPAEKLEVQGGQVYINSTRGKTLLNFEYDQGGDSTIYYQHLATLSSADGMVQVDGAIGAHEKGQGKASVNLIFSQRSGLVAQGIVNGKLNRSDIVVYEDGGVYKIYLVTGPWSQANLRLTTNGYSTLNTNPTKETSVSGTLKYSAKDDAEVIVDYNGNVGIGTTNPSKKLDVNGDVRIDGLNLYMRGDSSQNVALRLADSKLYVAPWGGDGHIIENVWIGGGNTVGLHITGDLSIGGTCLTSAQTDTADGITLASADDCPGGSIISGAYVEANLQTESELSAGKIDRFEEGDVLCWGIDQLELCAAANDRLVQAVADANGRPIIMGAEVVKVVGPVRRGDILVSSDVPGYAMVNNNPEPGAVIAQALEDFDGETGVIKAMIRKW